LPPANPRCRFRFEVSLLTSISLRNFVELIRRSEPVWAGYGASRRSLISFPDIRDRGG